MPYGFFRFPTYFISSVFFLLSVLTSSNLVSIILYVYIYIYSYIKNFLPNSIVSRRITQLRAKVQRYRKLLYRRNKTICRYKKKDVRHCRTWENITANLSGVQKTFFEMMSRNFHHAPEVCVY